MKNEYQGMLELGEKRERERVRERVRKEDRQTEGRKSKQSG